ncbi:MAG: hypothetical protein HFH76_03320 [Lachnospiraceae bacterium]|nr:hypothetical protein [Lachnospiraceae bacterium]
MLSHGLRSVVRSPGLNCYALAFIALSVMTRMSSTFTPSTAASTTRLSIVGSAVPAPDQNRSFLF